MSIQKIRQRMGLRQEDLAQKINVDRTTVTKWETGIASPRASMLLQLADLLNCTVDDLLRKD